MKDMIDMRERIEGLLERQGKAAMARKKVVTAELEERLKQTYADVGFYQRAGGYGGFSRIVSELVREGIFEPVKSVKGNGRLPELRAMYWQLPVRRQASWAEMDKLRVSDRLNLSAYARQPELQTEEEWSRIERLHRFLCEREKREWAAREERSLELFRDEKWLSGEEGAQFMRRLGLTLEDLKARMYGEPFVFWPKPGIRLHEARTALIVENLSIFHTVRRVLEVDDQVLGIRPELVIYGEGKKIEASLSFLNDIADAGAIDVLYAGDIDAEGWSIYSRLKSKYTGIRLRLAMAFFEEMAARLQFVPVSGGQVQREAVLEQTLEELRMAGGSERLLDAVRQSWRDKLRIPQEVLTVETLRAAAARNGKGGDVRQR